MTTRSLTIAILYLHSDVEISITMIENGSFYMLIFTISKVDSSENAIKGIFTSSFSHRFWHFVLAAFMPFWLRKIVRIKKEEQKRKGKKRKELKYHSNEC